MKLHILADLHIEFGHFKPPETDADLVILAGDTDLQTKGITWAKEAFAGKPVIYVPGNHEYYGEVYPHLREKMREAAADSNVHLLDCGRYEQDGVVFLGATLWTDFRLMGNQPLAILTAQRSMSDFMRIMTDSTNKRFRPEDTIQIHAREKAWLKKELQSSTGKKIVVVTHHLPSLQSVAERYRNDQLSAAFASNLDDLIAESGAKLWVHGHTHTVCDYMLGETRVLCNPRGYAGKEDTRYNPNYVVEI
ncbi:MAG: metallophosphoesterase [Deltaproteobacteria bacterium HGW-Deltaproteobacteria-3]|nr:MAG: metallophosphoesterase [Deltaproteobacteria bacterium HGW-Deltaproteobacteria-3]